MKKKPLSDRLPKKTRVRVLTDEGPRAGALSARRGAATHPSRQPRPWCRREPCDFRHTCCDRVGPSCTRPRAATAQAFPLRRSRGAYACSSYL